MSSTIKFTLSFSLVLLVAGCGDNGGNPLPRGSICAPKANPLPVDLNPKNEANKPQKLEMTREALSPYPGSFVYDGADIFYRNNLTNVQMQFRDTRNEKAENKDKAPQFALNVICVSGLEPGMPNLAFAESGISDFEVSQELSGLSNVGYFVRDYVVQFNKSRFPIRKVEKDVSQKFDSPSKVYEGEATQFFLYKMAANNSVDFQTRAHFVRGLKGEEVIDLVIRYKRVPPPPQTP